MVGVRHTVCVIEVGGFAGEATRHVLIAERARLAIAGGLRAVGAKRAGA